MRAGLIRAIIFFMKHILKNALLAFMVMGVHWPKTLAAEPDYFLTECERYLVSGDPWMFEGLPTIDLILYRDVTKARVFLYNHPVDRVGLKLVTHELVTREITLQD